MSGTVDGTKTICFFSSPGTVLRDHIGLSAFPMNQGNATGVPRSPWFSRKTSSPDTCALGTGTRDTNHIPSRRMRKAKASQRIDKRASESSRGSPNAGRYRV